jgi:RNA polymerase sigma-54 factor
MLNFTQSQKQTLKISPQQIQLLNFFQLNSLELEQYIKNELEENPILEEGNDIKDDFLDNDGLATSADDRTQDYMDWDEFSDDNTPDYKTRVNNFADDDTVFAPTLTETISWRQEVKEQFHLLVTTERQLFLADFLVDSLTDEGYLLTNIESLTDDVSFTSGIFVEEFELQEIADILHKIEPVGLGAANLQECLLMQLERLNEAAINSVAIRLVKDHFEELGTRNYDKLLKIADFSAEQIKEAIELIASLKPHPVVGGQAANSFVVKDNVIPDYIVMVEGEWLDVTLNSKGIPALHINKSYADDLGGSKAVNTYLNSKINAANWLIDAIQQRESTMLKTMKAIVRSQKEYFITGNVRLLKPMVLQDIAEQIKMDISTVSRVTSGKYAQTPFGVIHLKDLFTEGMKTDSGEEVSNRQIQEVLSELITNEDKHSPLNDFQLTELLADKGYNLARRTVAKYRDILGISAAPLRRIL